MAFTQTNADLEQSCLTDENFSVRRERLNFSEEEDEVVPASSRSSRNLLRAGVLAGMAAAVGAVCLLGSPHSLSTKASLSAATGLSKVGVAERDQVLSVASQQVSAGSKLAVAPLENLKDGNSCNDDEEELGGLCYAKCTTLTSGQKPFRKSGWTCCSKEKRPGFFGMLHVPVCQTSVGFCSGYSIAGMREGNAICPHTPGACLENEELHVGMCYMKCSLLTGGKYNFRSAAATCCKTQGLKCVAQEGLSDGFKGEGISDAAFAVGGGCGDDHDGTPCKPHVPLSTLTELK